MIRQSRGGELVPIPAGRDVVRAGFDDLPAIIRGAGERASWRFLEFFTANIRNKNTRQAYARAVRDFFRWCDSRKVLNLEDVRPFLIAAYIESHPGSAPTVKQHLAAIKMLFDWLVIGHIVDVNPASSVRGPKHVVRRGKTPVLKADQARTLLDSIKTDTIVGLRDRALIGVMVYSFARVSATIHMKGEDYYQNGKRWWFRLHEKGGASRGSCASQCRSICRCLYLGWDRGVYKDAAVPKREQESTAHGKCNDTN